MRGTFVTFEGVDGCGKSTVAREVVGRLEAEGRRVFLTSEPTHEFPTGRFIRELLRKEKLGENPVVEGAVDAELFFADRIVHNAKIIQPNLAAGMNVLSDRYYLSTLAYQWTQGVSLEYLLTKRNSLIAMGLVEKPAITILLDLPEEKAMERLQQMDKIKDKFEKAEFLTELRRHYLLLREKIDDKIHVVEAARPLQEVVKEVYEIILPALR